MNWNPDSIRLCQEAACPWRQGRGPGRWGLANGASIIIGADEDSDMPGLVMAPSNAATNTRSRGRTLGARRRHRSEAAGEAVLIDRRVAAWRPTTPITERIAVPPSSFGSLLSACSATTWSRSLRRWSFQRESRMKASATKPTIRTSSSTMNMCRRRMLRRWLSMLACRKSRSPGPSGSWSLPTSIWAA